MSAKHTPGVVAYAWSVDSMEGGYFLGGERASESDVMVFAKPIAKIEEAVVYDAAPDLLEALKVVMDQSWNGPLPDYARKIGADAIDKAEGRT